MLIERERGIKNCTFLQRDWKMQFCDSDVIDGLDIRHC